jgi:hypothetical protein
VQKTDGGEKKKKERASLCLPRGGHVVVVVGGGGVGGVGGVASLTLFFVGHNNLKDLISAKLLVNRAVSASHRRGLLFHAAQIYLHRLRRLFEAAAASYLDQHHIFTTPIAPFSTAKLPSLFRRHRQNQEGSTWLHPRSLLVVSR